MNATEKKLKILVVDDQEPHRKSAKALLAEHDLTVVSSYDEAREALTSCLDYDKANEFFAEKYRGGPYDSKDISEEDRKERMAYYKECQERATTHPDFDVVMTDLLMPASSQAQGGEGMNFVGKEMPIGTFLILLAMNAGVKWIAMVTDKNHHHQPASAALDPISRTVIKVGETRILATNYPDSVTFADDTGEKLSYDFLQSEEGKAKYPGKSDWSGYHGTWSGKGWNSILRRLMEGEPDFGF